MSEFKKAINKVAEISTEQKEVAAIRYYEGETKLKIDELLEQGFESVGVFSNTINLGHEVAVIAKEVGAIAKVINAGDKTFIFEKEKE